MIISFAVITSFIDSSLAEVYNFMPGTTKLVPVSPPFILQDPNMTDVYVALGANKTSANVSVKATSGLKEITYNGGFDNNPDGWFFVPGRYLVYAYWLPSLFGASGVVEIYGDIPPGSYDNASTYECVTLPNASLNELVLNVTYYVRYVPWGFHYLYAGLYDPVASTFVWFSSISPATNTWDTATFFIPASFVTPGETYYVFVGFWGLNLFWNYRTFYYFLDEVRLYANLSSPFFQGIVLVGNLTYNQSFDAALRLENYVFSGNVNLTLKLVNHTNYESTPIVIRDNALVNDKTSPVRISLAPAGYTSLRINLDVSMDPGSSVNITLTLSYNVDGVTVYYPIQINVTDPPVANGSSNASGPAGDGMNQLLRQLMDDIGRKLSLGEGRPIIYTGRGGVR